MQGGHLGVEKLLLSRDDGAVRPPLSHSGRGVHMEMQRGGGGGGGGRRGGRRREGLFLPILVEAFELQHKTAVQAGSFDRCASAWLRECDQKLLVLAEKVCLRRPAPVRRGRRVKRVEGFSSA